MSTEVHVFSLIIIFTNNCTNNARIMNKKNNFDTPDRCANVSPAGRIPGSTYYKQSWAAQVYRIPQDFITHTQCQSYQKCRKCSNLLVVLLIVYWRMFAKSATKMPIVANNPKSLRVGTVFENLTILYAHTFIRWGKQLVLVSNAGALFLPLMKDQKSPQVPRIGAFNFSSFRFFNFPRIHHVTLELP